MHLTDDALVLHYYDEDGPARPAAAGHLRTCRQCARAYEALARSLDAVTAPEFSGPIDALPTLRQLLLEGLEQSQSTLARRPWRGFETAWLGVWLVPLLYPLSVQTLFWSGGWAREHGAGPLPVVLSLAWACAGPLVAVLALQRMGRQPVPGITSRLLVIGALVSAISPSLFLLVSRVNLVLDSGVWAWPAALLTGALFALVPWPATSRPTARLSSLHRMSAALLTVFILGHIFNQALAFVSPEAYASMRGVMRVLSQHSVTYMVIVTAVLIQIVTGVAIGLKHVRPGAIDRNLQAASGWCLAAFLLVHVLSPFLPLPIQPIPASAASNSSLNLLATPRAAAQLPFLLLGVAAFLFHVGVYGRLAALTCMAEASVRRLSYAGAAVAVALVVAVGLSLCGVHL